MKNNKGLGVVEIILILTTLIAFVLIFGEKLAGLIGLLYSRLMAVL